MKFYEDATGKYVVGADSVPKKLGSSDYRLTIRCTAGIDGATSGATIIITVDIVDGVAQNVKTVSVTKD